MAAFDDFCIKLAIQEARQTDSEDARVHPYVGAVLAKDGEVLSYSHRGARNPGTHAEANLLEFSDKSALVGATLYTTFEPCTTKAHPVYSCAKGIAEARVKCVYIGMKDPTPAVEGKGIQLLRDAGIEVVLFPLEQMEKVEELNRDFSRFQRSKERATPKDPFLKSSGLVDACDSPPAVDFWVGRRGELAQMAAQQTGLITVTGIGGQGKSSLVAKYLATWTASNPGCHWDWRDLREDGDRFHTQLLRIIHRLTDGKVDPAQLSGADVQDLTRYLFQVLGQQRALFVLDNVDHHVDADSGRFVLGPNHLANAALHSSHNAVFLFTCRPRIDYASERFLEVFLSGLSHDESRQLFEERGVRTADAQIARTVDECHALTQGHPLWLTLIATHVAKNPETFRPLLQGLRRGEVDKRAKSMFKTIWDALLDRQKNILKCMAELSRSESADQIHSYLVERIKSRNHFQRALKSLEALSLVIPKTASSGETS